MPRVQSFDPIIGVQPRVLILGSMPGVESLKQQRYYAHPRNAFWPIMAALFDQQWPEEYPQRIAQLRRLPLILWDVLHSCHRPGSLDSSILADQQQANPIAELLQQYDSIRWIVFNGQTAEKLFRQHVLGSIDERSRFELIRLPSTSPAHASKNLQQKLEEWSVIRDYCE